jgi:hypothetical protein
MQQNASKDLQLGVFKLCFLITVMSNLVIYIAMPFHIIILEALASRCYMLCNLVAFLSAIYYCLKTRLPYKANQILIISIMIAFSLVSFMNTGAEGIYSYIIHIWCYLAFPIYLLWIDFLIPERKLVHYVFLINFITSVLFILLSLSSYSYKGYEHYLGTTYAWLTLGYDNPNQTSMYLLVNYIVLLCSICYYKKKLFRLILLADILYIGKLIYDANSRTCFTIAVLITIVILLKKNNKLAELSISAVLLIPVIFLIVYPFLYQQGYLHFEYMGKSDYSSRTYLYQNVFLDLKGHLLFGNFMIYRFENLHNGVLSILASLGVMGLLLFYLYCFMVYLNIGRNNLRSKISFIAFTGILAVFLNACTESALFVSGSMYAGSISVLIFLTKLKEVQSDEDHHIFKLSDTPSDSLL